MNKRTFSVTLNLLILLALAGLVLGCGGDDDGFIVPVRSFEVKVTNLTNNQPLSPLAVVLHTSGYSGWKVGQQASSGLEELAEGGSTGTLISEATASQYVLDTEVGTGIIAPGSSETVTLSAQSLQKLQLTAASMHVNTNDAFSGANGVEINALAAGEQLNIYANVYDAGTEANTETAATIPGPAGGGEGYNATRDDHDFISIHAGVVTSDDGLAGSALDESHRFDTPGIVIAITRSR